MTTRILVAKYVPDAARWEPVNVGVVVVRGTERDAAFLGEIEPGRTDAREFRHVVPAVEAYRAWIRYWRGELVDRGVAPEALEPVQGSSFFIAQAGEVWVAGDDRPIRDVVREYFDRLVKPLEEKHEDLQAAVERVLRSVDLPLSKGFHRDFEIETERLGARENVRFNYAYQNGSLAVAQRVPVNEAYAHDALWRFTGLGAEIRKIAFVAAREQDPRNEQWWDVLDRTATIVDVARPDAEEQVLKYFVGH